MNSRSVGDSTSESNDGAPKAGLSVRGMVHTAGTLHNMMHDICTSDLPPESATVTIQINYEASRLIYIYIYISIYPTPNYNTRMAMCSCGYTKCTGLARWGLSDSGAGDIDPYPPEPATVPAETLGGVGLNLARRLPRSIACRTGASQMHTHHMTTRYEYASHSH